CIRFGDDSVVLQHPAKRFPDGRIVIHDEHQWGRTAHGFRGIHDSYLERGRLMVTSTRGRSIGLRSHRRNRSSPTVQAVRAFVAASLNRIGGLTEELQI